MRNNITGHFVQYNSNTERSEQLQTEVTEISLYIADALAAGNGQCRIAVIQPTTFPYYFIDGGAGTAHLQYQYIFGTSL